MPTETYVGDQSIYLASPYSHKSKLVQRLRFQAIEEETSILLNNGFECIFSPIVHCHAIAENYELPGDFEFWKKYDHHMIRCLDLFGVMKLPGWQSSKGIAGEVEFAESIGRKIYYFDPRGEIAKIIKDL